MSEPDLALCVEAIRRAIVYGRGVKDYQKHPRKVDPAYARISVEGFEEAVKAIADNCPLPEDEKDKLLGKYRSWKESPWTTVAKFALSPSEIDIIPDTALEFLRDYFRYNEEAYRKYIP